MIKIAKEHLSNLKYTPQEIKKKRRKIYHQILTESERFDQGNFERIQTADLERLFELYDLYFLDSFFRDNYKAEIAFRLSPRMTKTAAKTIYLKDIKIHVIVLSTTLLFQTFDEIAREVAVAGIVCHDRLEAAMLLLEHETIHVLELALFGSSGCSQPRFQHMSRDIFGHTGVDHWLWPLLKLIAPKKGISLDENLAEIQHNTPYIKRTRSRSMYPTVRCRSWNSPSLLSFVGKSKTAFRQSVSAR